MTYPIQPRSSFEAAQIRESCQTLSLPQKFFIQDRRLTVCSSIAAAASRHEESHLIYGPLVSILLDHGFPVEYELDEFNMPHTGITFSHLQYYWLCRLQCKILLRHPATSSLGNIFWRRSRFSLKQSEPQTQGWLQRSCPQTAQTRLLLRLWQHISLTHSTMP